MAARRGLHGTLVDDLGKRIVHGEIKPGTLLPLDELGESYGASRTVVRETMKVLESKGLVVAKQNVGTRARDEHEWNALDDDVLRWRLTGPQAALARRELLEMRSLSEPTVAWKAATSATPAEIAALVDAVSHVRQAFGANQIAAFTAADIFFHAALFASADNSLLTELFSLVGTSLDDRAQLVEDNGLSVEALELHERVVEAVVASDAAAAAAAVRGLLLLSSSDPS